MPGFRVFCLECGSDCCLHLLQSPKAKLTPREFSIVCAVADPRYETGKEMAFALAIEKKTLDVYACRIYEKLGWYGGTLRRLALWAIAHRAELGIPLPMEDQFRAKERPCI